MGFSLAVLGQPTVPTSATDMKAMRVWSERGLLGVGKGQDRLPDSFPLGIGRLCFSVPSCYI